MKAAKALTERTKIYTKDVKVMQELGDKTLSVEVLSKRLNWTVEVTWVSVKRLLDKKLLNRTLEGFSRTGNEYEEIKYRDSSDGERPKPSFPPKPAKIIDPNDSKNVDTRVCDINPEIVKYVSNNLGKKSPKEIRKETGLSKLDYNFILIYLGEDDR